MPKVVVPLDGRGGVHDQGTEELHPDNRVDEEQHSHQHADVWQGFERLDERVQQDPHAHRPSQQLDQPCGPEQLQEGHGHDLGGVYNTAHDSDEVKSVPRVFEVIL